VSKIDDGGPIASSLANKTQVAENTYYTQVMEAQGGMTLRDYFAAAAMQGWLASFGPEAPHPALKNAENGIATLSYRVADAMIEARKEGV
jgi:hypothetical protein